VELLDNYINKERNVQSNDSDTITTSSDITGCNNSVSEEEEEEEKEKDAGHITSKTSVENTKSVTDSPIIFANRRTEENVEIPVQDIQLNLKAIHQSNAGDTEITRVENRDKNDTKDGSSKPKQPKSKC